MMIETLRKQARQSAHISSARSDIQAVVESFRRQRHIDDGSWCKDELEMPELKGEGGTAMALTSVRSTSVRSTSVSATTETVMDVTDTHILPQRCGDAVRRFDGTCWDGHDE